MAKDLTTGSPGKQLTLFAIPMLVSVIFQQFYNMADNIIAGQFLGDGPLAAVGNAYPATMIYMAVALGINIGCSVVISQYFGARNYERTKSAISTAILTTVGLALILMAAGLIFCEPLLRLLQTPEEIYGDTAVYLRIYTLGLVFIFLYNICTGTFNALGDSMTPLIFLICSSLGNVFMNLLFVNGFHMGVAGLAWATFLCQGVAAALAFFVLIKRIRGLPSSKYQIFSLELLKQEARLSIPGILQQSFISVGNLMVQGVVNSQGTIIIGAFSAVSKINTFAVQLMLTLSNAISAFAAQNIGAKRMDRVKQGLRHGLLLSLAVSAGFTALYVICSDQLLQIFVQSTSTEIIRVGRTFLQLVPWFYCIVCVKTSVDGVLHGAGAAKAFMASTFSDLILRVGLSYILSPFMGYLGIWSSWPIGWIVGTAISLWFYLRGSWKTAFKMET